MERLREITDESVRLWGHDGDRIVLLENMESRQAVRSVLQPGGTTIPLHASAAGKAMLARLPEHEVDEFLAQPAHRAHPADDHRSCGPARAARRDPAQGLRRDAPRGMEGRRGRRRRHPRPERPAGGGHRARPADAPADRAAHPPLRKGSRRGGGGVVRRAGGTVVTGSIPSAHRARRGSRTPTPSYGAGGFKPPASTVPPPGPSAARVGEATVMVAADASVARAAPRSECGDRPQGPDHADRPRGTVHHDRHRVVLATDQRHRRGDPAAGQPAPARRPAPLGLRDAVPRAARRVRVREPPSDRAAAPTAPRRDAGARRGLEHRQRDPRARSS